MPKTAPKTHGTRIDADPDLPTIRIVREFDAPPYKVFRAFTDAGLFSQWMGPKSLGVQIITWDARTGGSYRYSAIREGVEIASFYGSFHEVRPPHRLVRTFTYEDEPNGVSLETATFEDMGDARTRVTSVSLVENLDIRNHILASDMETGVIEGYEKLDALLSGHSRT